MSLLILVTQVGMSNLQKYTFPICSINISSSCCYFYIKIINEHLFLVIDYKKSGCNISNWKKSQLFSNELKTTWALCNKPEKYVLIEGRFVIYQNDSLNSLVLVQIAESLNQPKNIYSYMHMCVYVIKIFYSFHKLFLFNNICFSFMSLCSFFYM